MHETKVNREHKDSVFSDLFSDPAVLRELYSAIEGVEIPEDTPIVIKTLSDVLFKGQINDLAFTIDNKLVVLVEHQSTINNNMPLRLLMYLGREYEQIIDYDKVHDEKLLPIPKPEFFVLYNGKDEMEDYREFKLSDAFMNVEGLKNCEDDRLSLELIVKSYNINSGHNTDILKKCRILESYSIFMDKIKYLHYVEKLPYKKAVKKAMNFCIDHDILKEYLKKRGSEVLNMLFAEYKVERAVVYARKNALEEGEQRGENNVLNLLDKGLTKDEIKQRLEQEKKQRGS